MSMVEQMATKSFFKGAGAGCLKDKISHLVVDGCKSIPNTRGIEKLLCVEHVKRRQKAKFYKVESKLDKSLFGSHDPRAQKLALANAIINRCSTELTRCRRKHSNNRVFFNRMHKVRHNIIKCLAGFHGCCDKDSYVCQPKKGRQVTKCWGLTIKEMVTLQEVIEYR